MFYGRYFMFDVVANYHTKRRKQVMNDPERIERGAPGIGCQELEKQNPRCKFIGLVVYGEAQPVNMVIVKAT